MLQGGQQATSEYIRLIVTDSRSLRHTSVIGSLPDSVLAVQVLTYCKCLLPEENGPCYLRVTLRSDLMLAAQDSEGFYEGKARTRQLRKHLSNECQSVWGHVSKTSPTLVRVFSCACLCP